MWRVGRFNHLLPVQFQHINPLNIVSMTFWQFPTPQMWWKCPNFLPGPIYIWFTACWVIAWSMPSTYHLFLLGLSASSICIYHAIIFPYTGNGFLVFAPKLDEIMPGKMSSMISFRIDSMPIYFWIIGSLDVQCLRSCARFWSTYLCNLTFN